MNNPTMDTIQLLLDDHKRIIGLFRQFEASDVRAESMEAGVCREIIMELEIHTKIEETFVYLKLLECFQEESDKGLISECLSDHDELKESLADLKTGKLEHSAFLQKMTDVIDSVQDHLIKEESEVFPKAKSLASVELNAVCDQIYAEKERMSRFPEYQNSRPEIVQDPSGGEQKRIQNAA